MKREYYFIVTTVAFLIVSLLLINGCDNKKESKQPTEQINIRGKTNMSLRVKLQTNMGDITIELNEKAAPITVKNFLQYVNEGFYDGTIFHRVIKDFMIQGGGMTVDMRPKQTSAPIKKPMEQKGRTPTILINIRLVI